MSDSANIFGMISGIGKSFDDSYAAGRQRALEAEAPAIFGQLLSLNGGPSTTPVQGATLGTLGQMQPAASPAAPTFAAAGGAMGDYLKTTRAKESGGNDLAANPSSTAKGRYQFTDGTWTGVAQRHPELGLQPGGWKDPDQQERAMQAFTADNAKALTAAGIPINPGNLYVSHFLGEAGGPKFITGAMQNPDAPAVAFVSPGAARANRSIFFEKDGRPKTAGAVYAERTSRYGGAPMQAAAAPGQPVAVANSEAETQALEQRMGMVPTQTAEADMPARDAVPAGFIIPGQAAAPAATPAPAPAQPQGFAGFGTGASRMSPEQAAVLQTAWRNPVTRPMATQIYGELLRGQASPWKLQQMGDQPVLFNERTAQIVPVGQGKRSTTTVGNAVVDTATGQVIYQGQDRDASKLQTVAPGYVLFDPVTRQPVFTAPNKETEPKYSMQTTQDGTLLAVNPANPADVQVIRPGQAPRPLTADERRAYGVPDGAAAGMGPDGKPFGIGGGSKTEVNVDTKGAGKFSEKANEIQAKRYGEMVDAADNAVPLRSDIDTMAEMATRLNTGRLAEARLGLAQYAREAGFDSIATSLTGGKMGEMEAFTALADKLVPRMRVPGSGSTSDAEGRAFKNSLPSLLKTPGGNALIADTFKGLADYQAQVGGIAGKALRQEISQAEADQAIRDLPSPYARFKEYRAAQGDAPQAGGSTAQAPAAKTEGRPQVVKGARPPEGYTWYSYLAKSRETLKSRPDLRPQIEDMLAKAGIPPEKLGR